MTEQCGRIHVIQREWYFNENALLINVYPSSESGGKRIIGSMHFLPDEKLPLTSRLLIGIKELKAFFTTIDNDPTKKEPEYLTGDTGNNDLAMVTQRLGFITKDTGYGIYHLSAKTADVRKNVKALTEEKDAQGKTVFDRLSTRAQSQGQT